MVGRSKRNTVLHMSWWEYVEHLMPSARQQDVAAAAGVTAPTVSRWSRREQGVDPRAAAAFARANGRPVLEAFVAAGFLTSEEANETPTATPSLGSLTDEQLLHEVRRRMSHAAPTTHAGVSPATDLASRRPERVTSTDPDDPTDDQPRQWAAHSEETAPRQSANRRQRRREWEELGEGSQDTGSDEPL